MDASAAAAAAAPPPPPPPPLAAELPTELDAWAESHLPGMEPGAARDALIDEYARCAC
jgi:hypothetical protein